MPTSSPLWLILNPASGSNGEAANAELIAALSEAGQAPARIIDCAANDLPDRSMLEAGEVGTLAIYTGDGTANAALTQIEGWSGAALVLPGGTSNLLAKALHGDRPAAVVAAEWVALERTRRSCIRCAQGTALIEVLAGPGATWSDVREELREGALAEFAAKAVEAIRASTTGPQVRIAEPRVGRDEGYVGVRLTPSDAGMVVDGYGADNAIDYARHAGALLRRNFREGPHDELGTHDQLVCASVADAPVELMIDGERRTGSVREQFSLAPFALDLLASSP